MMTPLVETPNVARRWNGVRRMEYERERERERERESRTRVLPGK